MRAVAAPMRGSNLSANMIGTTEGYRDRGDSRKMTDRRAVRHRVAVITKDLPAAHGGGCNGGDRTACTSITRACMTHCLARRWRG